MQQNYAAKLQIWKSKELNFSEPKNIFLTWEKALITFRCHAALLEAD
jgi:hypothetical protein